MLSFKMRYHGRRQRPKEAEDPGDRDCAVIGEAESFDDIVLYGKSAAWDNAFMATLIAG